METQKKTKITYFNVDWMRIKEACMETVGKKAGKKEPSQEWKRNMLICQHSPIRRGEISWKWNDIPFCNMGHLVRHSVGCTPYVKTSRTDRTGVDRSTLSQTEPVSMQMDANINSLQNIAMRRLCYQADKTTREYVEDLKDEIEKYDEDVAWSLVPQCVYRGGCCEPFGNCNFYTRMTEDVPYEELTDIEKRYDLYNQYFRDKMEKKKQIKK